jgi:hypothetical protein
MPGFQKIMITPLSPKLCSTYEPESAAYTTRRAGWDLHTSPVKHRVLGTQRGSLWGKYRGARDKRCVSPITHAVIGSILHPSRPHHALQGAYGVKISRRASRAPFAHSITFHAAVRPFYYSSRTHRSHEHHDWVFQYYRLRYKHRQRPD